MKNWINDNKEVLLVIGWFIIIGLIAMIVAG